MDLGAKGSGSRFSAYVEGLVGVIGHADRARPLRDYCLGLLMPGERKSVEPLAAVTAPARVAAQHQSLLHFVGNAPWSDERVLAKVRALVLPAIEAGGPIEAWIVDDTSFPKKGRHSVGVARQYCGELGKPENCQVAVSLSIANHAASLPVAWRLYLPEAWAADPARRAKAGVPEEVGFLTKPEIALEQIRAAVAAGIPRGTVLMDAVMHIRHEFVEMRPTLALDRHKREEQIHQHGLAATNPAVDVETARHDGLLGLARRKKPAERARLSGGALGLNGFQQGIEPRRHCSLQWVGLQLAGGDHRIQPVGNTMPGMSGDAVPILLHGHR